MQFRIPMQIKLQSEFEFELATSGVHLNSCKSIDIHGCLLISAETHAYCPGGTKRRMTLPHRTPPFRSKNLFSCCRNMFGWFWEVGGTPKNHTHRRVSSFYYLVERKVRKTTKIMFRMFNICNSSPILFCPKKT